MSVMKAPVAPPVVSETAAILSVIERAAANPDVDLDKLERLLEMRERVEAQQARKAYYSGMAEMRPALPSIKKEGVIDIGRGKPISFAKWEDINDAIVPVLSSYGFSIFFITDVLEGKVKVTCKVAHEAGHSEETSLPLPADTSGSKNAVQSIGSSVSYGKRYTAAALLNLTSRDGEPDRDDNGMAGGGTGELDFVDSEQVKVIKDLIKQIGTPDAEKTFCDFYKIETIFDLPAFKYARAVAALKQKVTRK
jgi:hypothetical protein